MAQALMAQWRAGEIRKEESFRDLDRGRMFICVDSEHLPIMDGDWVIVTQSQKFGICVRKSAVPFASNYKVIDNLVKLYDLLPELKPFIYRLFYGRVQEALENPSNRGFSRRVNGFENKGYFYVNSEVSIPGGTVVEVLKGSRGFVVNVAPVDIEGEVYLYPTWHEFLEAARKKVSGLSPYQFKVASGVVVFCINHLSASGTYMTKDVVDVPGEEGKVCDLYLIHLGEGAVNPGDAIDVWAENGRLFCEKTSRPVSMVFDSLQEIVNELEPKLESRLPQTSSEFSRVIRS